VLEGVGIILPIGLVPQPDSNKRHRNEDKKTLNFFIHIPPSYRFNKILNIKYQIYCYSDT